MAKLEAAGSVCADDWPTWCERLMRTRANVQKTAPDTLSIIENAITGDGVGSDEGDGFKLKETKLHFIVLYLLARE